MSQYEPTLHSHTNPLMSYWQLGSHYRWRDISPLYCLTARTNNPFKVRRSLCLKRLSEGWRMQFCCLLWVSAGFTDHWGGAHESSLTQLHARSAQNKRAVFRPPCQRTQFSRWWLIRSTHEKTGCFFFVFFYFNFFKLNYHEEKDDIWLLLTFDICFVRHSQNNCNTCWAACCCLAMGGGKWVGSQSF